MGCFGSSPQVAATRPNRPVNRIIIDPYYDENAPVVSPKSVVSPRDVLLESAAAVIQGISRLPQSPGMLPLVCLTELTCPLCMAPLCKSNGDQTGIYLAAAAATLADKGRVVVVGHVSILGACTAADTEAAAFLENVTRFCGGGSRDTYRVLLVGIPQKMEAAIKKNIRGFDFVCDTAEDFDVENKPRYHVVVFTTGYTKPERVREYVASGGGVIIGGMMPDQSGTIAMRELLLEYGIGIPDCPLSVGIPGKEQMTMRWRKIEELASRNFPGLCEKFIDVASRGKEASLEVLDPLVTTLQYHLTVMPPGKHELMLQLWKAAWQLLDDTEGAAVDGSDEVCPQLVHSITSVLLSELLSAMDPTYFEGVDRSMPFPGKCGEVTLQDFGTALEIPCDGWYSTGLYLPPGVVATAKFEAIPPNCEVQVGSHSECILSKHGPWKRWATVVTHAPIIQNEVTLASPFGGIIYIAVYDFELDEPLKVSVNFSGITRYPMYSIASPQMWEETSMCNVPWAELETQFVMFTMPTHILADIQDKEGTCMFIDSLVVALLQWTSDESMRLYRVVFDVEVLDQVNHDSYPIIMSMESINGILFSRRQSIELFHFLELIAERSIPTDGFPDEAVAVFARLAAYVTFQKIWPDDDPQDYFPNESPPLWERVFNIYSENEPGMISKSIEQVRQAMAFVPTNNMNLYQILVKKINMNAKKDYTSDLVKDVQKHTGNLLLGGSSHSLLEFQLDRDETSPLPS